MANIFKRTNTDAGTPNSAAIWTRKFQRLRYLRGNFKTMKTTVSLRSEQGEILTDFCVICMGQIAARSPEDMIRAEQCLSQNDL